MFGSVDETLTAAIVNDSMGAQILSVLFFDEFGDEVIPASGYYSVQYSPNGFTWIDFEGAQFPARVSDTVKDWQSTGVISHIRIVPIDIVGADSYELEYRTHGVGMPSFTSSMLTANRYLSSVNTSMLSMFDNAVLQGNAISVSQKLVIPANSKMSIRFYKNVEAAITYARAHDVFISYVDGDVSGELTDIASATKLNTLEPFDFEASFEFYDGESTGIKATTEKYKVDNYFVADGGGVIELDNVSDSDVTTYFSCGLMAVSDPITPYMLTANTQLTATTEMSDYNGPN